MFKKQHIVNFLFVVSFSFFGIGKYLAFVVNFSLGTVIGILPLLVLLLFYWLDIIYQTQPLVRVSKHYLLLLLFSAFYVLSYLVGLRVDVPGLNAVNTFTITVYILVVLHAGLIVHHYNRERADFSIADLLYWGLTLLVATNLLGYAAGLRNVIHAIPGRINLPFSQGLYSTASTVAIINLMIISRWLKGGLDARYTAFSIGQFLLNLVLMGGINSRLSILTFVLALVLWLSTLRRAYALVFVVSFFTLPLLLRSAQLIYELFKLPMFSSILKRVSYKDITGFNGRDYLWESGMEWFVSQGEGFWWGNGYMGHYTIGLLSKLSSAWDRKHALGVHMHSSMLDFLLACGVIGTIPLVVLMFFALRYSYRQYKDNLPDASLLGVMFYLIIIFEIDNYMMNGMGFLIFATISTCVVTGHREVQTKPAKRRLRPVST